MKHWKVFTFPSCCLSVFFWFCTEIFTVLEYGMLPFVCFISLFAPCMSRSCLNLCLHLIGVTLINKAVPLNYELNFEKSWTIATLFSLTRENQVVMSFGNQAPKENTMKFFSQVHLRHLREWLKVFPLFLLKENATSKKCVCGGCCLFG